MHSPRWLLEEGPDASAHHAAAIQAPRRPVSRISRLTAPPQTQTAQPSPRPGGQFSIGTWSVLSRRRPQSAFMQQPPRHGEAAGF
jgi:hypothetical protein